MKVAVITLHAVKNYGSVLQAIATQRLLEDRGCEVEIVHFLKESEMLRNSIRIWAKGNPVRAVAMAPTVLRWKTVFDDYCASVLHLSPHTYTCAEDFLRYPVRADAYCTGSDQVWNSVWNRKIIPEFYLSFAPENSYKFAFAASFGQDWLSDEEVQETQQYIRDYRSISVREDSAVTILEKQYHYPGAVQLTDPTICLEADFWRSLADGPRQSHTGDPFQSPADSPHPDHTGNQLQSPADSPAQGRFKKQKSPSGDYILVYNLNRSRAFDRYAAELAKRAGLRLVRLCTRYDQILRPGKSVLVPTVPEFIQLIDRARYVLTDSFHATAFSMNLGTEPVCVTPPQFGTRIDSFLTLTGSQQRRVRSYDDFDVLQRPVDFSKVHAILARERERAGAYLDRVVREIGEYQG